MLHPDIGKLVRDVVELCMRMSGPLILCSSTTFQVLCTCTVYLDFSCVLDSCTTFAGATSNCFAFCDSYCRLSCVVFVRD